MATTLTYQQAFNLITEAYIKGEIKPYNANFCFCGTIAPEERNEQGYKNWNNSRDDFDQSKHFYTLNEYARMEKALLIELNAWSSSVKGKTNMLTPDKLNSGDKNYEDCLFNGMCAALEVLKQIHQERGENIDDTPVFTKRELAIQ